MATTRKRNKPQADLAPKEVKGKEADRVQGGKSNLLGDMISKLIQMRNDMQKAVIGNLRA